MATVLALCLVATTSLVAVAQDEAPMAPAAVLGWLLDETHYADGESGEVGDMFVRAGVGYTYRVESTDPRLEGEAIWIGTGHRFPTEPMFEVQSATWELTNDDGGWIGTSTAIIGNGLGDTDTMILTGTGAYEGLTAYLVSTWSRAGAHLRGAIFPGDMPPTP
jgi:hypothetical protein